MKTGKLKFHCNKISKSCWMMAHKVGPAPKPPNILVYCGRVDSARKFDIIRSTLRACVSSNFYTIYQLKHEDVASVPWQAAAVLLLVVADSLDQQTQNKFLQYFNQGGSVFSCGSSFDTLFMERGEREKGVGLAELSLPGEKWQNVTCVKGTTSYKEGTCLRTGVDISVIGYAQPLGLPVLVNVRAKDDGTSVDTGQSGHPGGRAVLAQVHLEEDPTNMAGDPDTFHKLKLSNSVRIEILQFLLSWLGVNCQLDQSEVCLSPACLLTSSQDRTGALMSSLQTSLKNGCIKSKDVTLQFVEGDNLPEGMQVTASHLPVLWNSSTSVTFKYFRPQIYWDNLKSRVCGRVLVYADVIPTTMVVPECLQFSVPHESGLVVIAGRQTSGRGRGGNQWLSPAGCAMFSLLLHIPVNSNLGQRVSFLQHIASLAVVHSVISMQGYEKVDLRLKWPNDIYYSNRMKLGGVIVNSTILGSTIHATIGCGFNVSNKNPTICINDIIELYNKQNGDELLPCTTEQLLARTVTYIEQLVTDFQTQGHEYFCTQYYERWLHTDSQVKVESEGGKEVTIIGVDEYGYLQVQPHDGRSFSLQPDGNTFDMMQNLISIKK